MQACDSGISVISKVPYLSDKIQLAPLGKLGASVRSFLSPFFSPTSSNTDLIRYVLLHSLRLIEVPPRPSIECFKSEPPLSTPYVQWQSNGRDDLLFVFVSVGNVNVYMYK